MDESHAAVARGVAATLGGVAWTITALPGSNGRTFLAEGQQRVVFRFADAPAVLERVGRIGAGPRVLGEGVLDGRPYVVQEHLSPGVVDRAWIARNHDAVARLLALVQSDPGLAALARPLTPRSFLDELGASASGGTLPAVTGLIAALGSRADDLDPMPLVPTHGDPNASNFLASGDGLRLVDWDDVRRSDPVRDLGQVAWWYLAEAAWPAFMAAAGTPWGKGVERRLAWWVAAESTEVALGLWPRNPVAAVEFVRDAEAAIEGRPNPRRE